MPERINFRAFSKQITVGPRTLFNAVNQPYTIPIMLKCLVTVQIK